MSDFRGFMDVALEEARAAAKRGEVPVGAAIVRAGAVIARAGNRMRDRLRAMGGRQSTILSGGGFGNAPVSRPTILGG